MVSGQPADHRVKAEGGVPAGPAGRLLRHGHQEAQHPLPGDVHQESKVHRHNS
jgi:hypothetical protein